LKGQYLAVETVFIFGLGIILSTGVIVTFDRVRGSVMDSVEEKQVEILDSKIKSSLYSLEQSDYGNEYSYGKVIMDLPDEIGGKDYTVDLNRNEIIIGVGGESYERDFKGLRDYYISGSVSGGKIELIKQGNEVELSGN
jgi:hypothetical protein